MNQSAEKLFSSSLYPLSKGKDHEFENLTLFLNHLRQVGFGNTTEPIKISLALSGHPRTFEVRAESLHIKSHMVQAIFVMDVSHEESWNAHTDACSASLLKSKKELIDCVAHEVRTPLNRIVGFSSLLKDTTLSPLERERYFNEVMEGSNQLLNTINNLIKITITQAKLSDHDYKDIDINTLIESVSTQS
jgi:signal transduction histidine kinase